MNLSLRQLSQELSAGKRTPFYLVIGTEPFQASLVKKKILESIVPKGAESFCLESFDGESLDTDRLIASLDTLGGLFAESRLVLCRHFDKAPASAHQAVLPYLKKPSDTTVFLMLCEKVDRRREWVKIVEECGSVIEVTEPYEREWPSWKFYFDKKLQKSIHPEAWLHMVESNDRKLALVASEIEKIAVFAAERKEITLEDVQAFNVSAQDVSVFSFAEAVAQGKAREAAEQLHVLHKHGENDVLVLSILLRQFSLIEKYHAVRNQSQVSDKKWLAGQLGINPYFVGKIIDQATRHNKNTLRRAKELLTECDYAVKTGGGSLWEGFLIPYFAGRDG